MSLPSSEADPTQASFPPIPQYSTATQTRAHTNDLPTENARMRSDDMSSCSSSQPLTRASTATGSDDSAPLVTPFDDVPIGRAGHGQGRKSGEPDAAGRDGVRIRSPSDTSSAHSRRIRPLAEAVEGDLRVGRGYGWESSEVQHGSYFASRSRQAEDGNPATSAALGRRGTTKELIGHFEVMGGSSAPARSSSAGRARDGSLASYAGDRTPVQTDKAKEKGRSPIRQSFRNLLSVFKKTKPAQKERQDAAPGSVPSLPGTRYKTGGAPADKEGGARIHAPAPPSKPSLTLQIPSTNLAKTDPRNCTSPISAHASQQGPLLYLCRLPAGPDSSGPGSAGLPPVWMPCLAQLHTTHVLISWQTAQGNPTNRLVPFTACTDVRSLALGELSAEERALLPDGRPELRVFELLFEGRAREKFAVEGVTERAGWVSAIWDAVLLTQENRIRSPAVTESVYAPSSAGPVTPEPVPEPQPEQERDNSGTTSTGSRISQVSSAGADHALPPVPSKATERPILARLDLRDLPPVSSRQSSLPSGLSPLPAPPITPTSVRGSAFLSPTRADSPSRTPSPSIQNLDRRSVVKQRLAQIEQITSAARCVSPASSSARRWELKDSPRMQRRGSTSSSAAASILNSYTDSASPRSSCSGRLTTLPPSPIGSPPPRHSRFGQEMEGRGSRFLGLPKQESAILSPASQYSSNDGMSQAESMNVASPIRSGLDALAIPLPASIMSIAPLAQRQEDSVDKGAKPTSEVIRDKTEVLSGHSVTDSASIVNIRTMVDEVLTEVRGLRSQGGNDPNALKATLEDVRLDIKGDLSKVRGLVEDLKDSADAAGKASTVLATPDIAEFHEKLDGLLRLCQSKQGEGCSNVAETCSPPKHELAEVVTMLKDAEEQRVTQMEQQTDSIRYLNELNTWLEAFVKHGTSQIEGVAAGVQQLCRDLGPLEDRSDTEGDDAQRPRNVLSDMRLFLEQHKEREENTATLQASVNGLIAAVQEDLRRNAEARNMLTTESVIGMIDRQRQDQERMLKALATELSNDIRGERLRFVEAMKEATAINVQIHVEEFKKELTREVMLMTQEVTRLQRERQGLEQQIADLFAFYAKQKQAGKVVDGGRMPAQGLPLTQTVLTVMPGAMPPATQSGYRRPLPSPAPSPTRPR
ncbi:hypothetical protein BD414DRAFT_534966 [Trametes punicea]|nr:hypothetical protein BD414DRAFT_534966 [Trametes punicea]